MKILLWTLAALALLGVAGLLVFVYLVQNVETPPYRVVERQGAFEIRDYPPMVVAEVHRAGSRQQGLRAGFGPLARYIFAKERGGERPEEMATAAPRIAMTAPVEQQAAPRIAMTAPVEQQAAPVEQSPLGEQGGQWAVRFIMPQQYRLEDLPAPAGDVRLYPVPARRLAAVRFSGRANDALLGEQERALADWLAGRGITPVGSPIYAYYNDPFTPGFLRRNEVLWELPAAAR